MKDDKFLKCIVDANRRKILKFLGEGEKCVNEISEFTGIEQSLVSHHLKMLRDCGLVKGRQDGKKTMYSLSDDEIYSIIKMIEKVAYKIIKECE
ncbi:MAG: winged helix-turn-helix transcriptional regulator [Thermoplasmatales archaeon]|nr:winged helix-turn-helix transcriptional regulator [Thermoplasmatales archaeon]